MTETMKQTRLDRIAQHGRNLLAIFPNATERDPVKLCKKLRRLEIKANQAAIDLCNVPNYQDRAEAILERVAAEVTALLKNQEHTNTPNVFINRDPRGYALKISDQWLRAFDMPLHRDMGGYGIVAPEID